MKMSHDLIKDILTAFEATDSSCSNVNKIAKLLNISLDEKLLYHFMLISDQGLICGTDGSKDIGISIGANDTNIAITDIRLKALGHEYLNAIRKPEMWEKLKKIAGHYGLSTMISASQALLQEIIKKQIQ